MYLNNILCKLFLAFSEELEVVLTVIFMFVLEIEILTSLMHASRNVNQPFANWTSSEIDFLPPEQM